MKQANAAHRHRNHINSSIEETFNIPHLRLVILKVARTVQFKLENSSKYMGSSKPEIFKYVGERTASQLRDHIRPKYVVDKNFPVKFTNPEEWVINSNSENILERNTGYTNG